MEQTDKKTFVNGSMRYSEARAGSNKSDTRDIQSQSRRSKVPCLKDDQGKEKKYI